MSDMSHLIFSFIRFSCLTHVVLESIHWFFCYFGVFYLNIPIVLWFDYLCPICHILIFSFILFFLSHTHIWRNRFFFMFVIFLLIEPSAIFVSCGLLARAICQPLFTAKVPSCCPLPPLSLPPLALPPSSTIEAAHCWCSGRSPYVPCRMSATTVCSCCICMPLMLPPLLPSSKSDSAEVRWLIPPMAQKISKR